LRGALAVIFGGEKLSRSARMRVNGASATRCASLYGPTCNGLNNASNFM
jgi:hypothetical protein